MPFVHLDANGKILAVYTESVEGASEVSPDDPALKAFIQQNIPQAGGGAGGINPDDDWVQSDLALARVIEDLIEVLLDKKLIMFTDFPEGAQKKLLDRRGLRKEFDLVEDLFGDGSDENFDDGSGQGGGGIL
ncbi:MAG: tryptophan synthase subunit beta like protein [Rhodospirillales bacterium]|nr:tryptophan synthase subunit beta like protein [Rhodospirillales bacterium]